jgi:hypothetical protein
MIGGSLAAELQTPYPNLAKTIQWGRIALKHLTLFENLLLANLNLSPDQCFSSHLQSIYDLNQFQTQCNAIWEIEY